MVIGTQRCQRVSPNASFLWFLRRPLLWPRAFQSRCLDSHKRRGRGGDGKGSWGPKDQRLRQTHVIQWSSNCQPIVIAYYPKFFQSKMSRCNFGKQSRESRVEHFGIYHDLPQCRQQARWLWGASRLPLYVCQLHRWKQQQLLGCGKTILVAGRVDQKCSTSHSASFGGGISSAQSQDMYQTLSLQCIYKTFMQHIRVRCCFIMDTIEQPFGWWLHGCLKWPVGFYHAWFS